MEQQQLTGTETEKPKKDRRNYWKPKDWEMKFMTETAEFIPGTDKITPESMEAMVHKLERTQKSINHVITARGMRPVIVKKPDKPKPEESAIIRVLTSIHEEQITQTRYLREIKDQLQLIDQFLITTGASDIKGILQRTHDLFEGLAAKGAKV